MKICIVVHSLSMGGAEKSSALLSKMLVDSGYEVLIVSDTNEVVYEFKGDYLSLEEAINSKKGYLSKIRKVIYFRNILRKEKFDYVIDTRSRRNWLKQLVFNLFVFHVPTTIFMVHNYNLSLYFPKNVSLARFLYKKAFKLVGVSMDSISELEKKYGFTNAICIYNAFDEKRFDTLLEEKVEVPKGDYILSYGRIVEESKDYSFLVKAYSKSQLPSLGINLYIVGDGPDKVKIENLVKELDMEDYVYFESFKANPLPYVKNALFTTLTSNFEGFPMVLVESLRAGTPVVAIDCKSGPSEVIITGKNGVLVPWKSEEKFVDGLNKMVLEDDFYRKCKKGTVSSVLKYEMKNINKEWKTILS